MIPVVMSITTKAPRIQRKIASEMGEKSNRVPRVCELEKKMPKANKINYKHKIILRGSPKMGMSTNNAPLVSSLIFKGSTKGGEEEGSSSFFG
jgi:hypothetical protein